MSNPFVQIGVVTGFEITTNRTGEQNVVMLQVALSEETDVQSVELYNSVGKTGVPPIDSAVLVLTVAEGFKIAIAINDGLDVINHSEGECLSHSQDEDGIRRTEILQKANGDLELKSIDSNETIKSSIELNNAGNVIINSGTDWAVRFSALETAFNDLQDQWNAFAAAYVPGSPTVQGLPATADTSTESISDAKIDSIRVP